jgi:hypothetical protein
MIQYIPGVCNIGPDEISRRKQAGLMSFVIAALLLLFFILFHIPSVYRVIIFFPATLSAVGYLQAYFHFCAAFGLKGVYNILKPAGQTETILQKEFRKKDQQKAIKIIVLSIFIGVILTGIIYYFPF